MKAVSVVAIDLAKNNFQVHGADRRGRCVLSGSKKRKEMGHFLAQIPPSRVVMEACASSHYWAREARKYGHEAQIIAPQFVKPFVKSQKNDRNDAEAICEAALRPTMRYVPVKERQHQDLQTLHRIRSRVVQQKVALTNQLKGFLLEYGICLSAGEKVLKSLRLHYQSEIEEKLTPFGQELLDDLLQEYREILHKLASYDQKILKQLKQNEKAQHLTRLCGVGPITATAMIASVSQPQLFRNGREFAAWLGLIPRQHSSGGKTKLLSMTKRGDVYLRTLLIHGARSQLRAAQGKTDRTSVWALQKKERHGMNKAAVALAHKNAKLIWALLMKGDDFVF